MFKIKHNLKRIISIMCVLTLFVQTLIVSANDAEKSNLQKALESATYTSIYADAENAEMALATAKKQVQSVISAQTEANENTATFVVNDSPVLNINAKGGTYTFTVTVTLADSTSFTTDTLTMNVSARPEPLKVVFDDPETVAGANLIGEVDGAGTFIDETADGGKAFMRMEQGSKEMIYENFVEQCGLSTMDFDQYPYVRLSFRSDNPGGYDEMQLYWFKDEGNSFYTYCPWKSSGGMDTDWKEVIFDMRTGAYDFKKGAGGYDEIVDQAGKTGSLSWTGEGTVRFDLCNYLRYRTVDLEYVAFFGSKAEAEAYPVELGNLKYMLENSEYTATYKQAETVEMATTLATSQLQAVIGEWALDSGETATFTIENGELSRYSKGGTFTFDLTVTEANSTPYDVSLTMTIGARPKPLVVVFNDEKTVNGANILGASKQFVDETADGGKTFMRMEQDSKEMIYENFVEQCGLSTMDFDQYPYVRLSFRSDNPGGYDEMQMYWFKDEGNSFYTYCPWKSSGGTDTDWKEVIFDMRTGAYDFKKGAGGYDEIVDQAGKTGSLSWTGEGTVRFDLCNYLRYRTVDLEYVAFFSTLKEAEAYPSIKESTSILSSTAFTCESDVNFTEQKAHSEITEQIAALELPAAYTLENGVYVAPTATVPGSYSIDVVFTATGDRVVVTLQIAKTDRVEYFEKLTIDTYRSGDTFSYPESKEIGYIFAGWYDVETQKPIAGTVKTGQALAKFVDADILKVKIQAGLVETDSGNVIPNDKARLRFITTVDDVDYKEVAFTISLQTVEQGDGTYNYTEPTSTVTSENAGIVYEKLYYVGMSSGETMKDYVPSVFSSYSKFFKTYTLSEIPGTAYDTNIRVTPYWETLDGTTVYGQTRTITVNEVKATLSK